MAVNSEVSALALPGSPYGSFAGKEASAGSGPHNPGALSEVSCISLTGGLYGSFAGKEASAVDTTPDAVGGDDVPQAGYLRGERKRRGLERRKRRSDAERIAEMQRAYARLTGEAPDPAVAAAVAEAVRPHVETASDTRLPPVEAIDWRGMLDDLGAIAVLLQLYQRAIDEEDEVALLLLSQ